MKRELVIVIVAALGLSACGGGSSSSSSTDSTTATGFAIPTEISAVPTDSGAAAHLTRGLTSHLHALARAVSDLPADSDYKKTTTRKYIEEHSLEQFSIIETIMKAVAQTNYADAGNIGIGPYKAMIAWEDKQGDVDVKTLEPWIVSSSIITLDGQTVNRLQAWIEEVDNGTPRVVKAQFDIYQSATQNADGSYADYGVWDLNVKFNDAGTDFFAASATIENGVTVLKINQSETRQDGGMPQPVTFTTKAIMHRAGGQGYGQVAYTDMSCDQNGCVPNPLDVKYAYTTDYVALDDGSGVVYKDRTSQTEFANRYGLFYAAAADDDGNGKAIAAGDNLTKHKSFGFPVSFTDGNGNKQHAYYGAWQGRHSLWANGGGVTAGTTVTREDHGANTAAETYTVSASFNGTLTRRDLHDASLSDIQNIPFETFVNKFLNLSWDGSNWQACGGFMDWSTNPPTCRDFNGNAISTSPFADFGSLVIQANDRKNVNINRWDQNTQSPVDYVYLDSTNSSGVANYSVPGFYTGTRNQMGQVVADSNSTLYIPVSGDMINVNIGGSIYIQYTGNFTSPNTGWVQKKLESFDQQTWTPTFAVGGDTAFTPELGREYYIHSNGVNFVVNRIAQNGDAADYSVKIELQSAANPSTVTSIMPANTSYLANPWNKDVHYTLDATSTDTNFMMMVYANDDPATPDDDTGTVLESGQWGLQAYSVGGQPLDGTGAVVTVDANGIPNGATRPVQFNWEYADPNGGNSFGAQQFLIDADGNYKLLSDPVSLNPITVTDGSGASKTLSLQFDGWMHGLPDLHQELSKNNWKMSADISDKIVNIPEGTTVTDSDGIDYYVKPLEVSVFIDEVDVGNIPAGSVPDLTQVSASELDNLPTFVEHNMGALPTNDDGSPLAPKYSEGNPVE